MWLKSYLNLGPDRALWAFVADATMAAKTPISENNVNEKVRMNPLLQSWKTSTGNGKNISPDIRNLISTSETLKVRPEGLAFSREILRQMPIWYHREADKKIRSLNHAATSDCLRDKHGVLLVGEAEKIARCENTAGHLPTDECECVTCNEMEEESGCQTPHSCILKAKQLLNTLPVKWVPRKEQPEDYEKEVAEGEDDEGWITFNPNVTVHGTLADIFRIFTEGNICNNVPDLRPDDVPIDEEIAATDGSCFNNGQDNASAGAGIFYEDQDPRNRAIKIPPTIIQSNQTAEMVGGGKQRYPQSRVRLEICH